jgi:release factor glutamine methyltransferase
MTTDEPWTIGRLLSWTVEYLSKHGAENPRLDAEILLAAARGCRRIDLYAAYGDEASNELRTAFRELVRRRAAGTPVAYLVGHREFYALDFEVTPDVLIPRPETESLVVALLDHVKAREGRANFPHLNPVPAKGGVRPEEGVVTIADVGTGSGVLAICAAKYVPRARVTAIDISPAALVVAQRNAERHGVAEQIHFVESDLFAGLPTAAMFDYIVSNPPYVSTAELTSIATEVREYEPRVALAAGEQGTDVVAPLIQQSAKRLHPGGMLLVEISPMIAGKVEQLIRENGALESLPTLRDLAGHARVVRARLQDPPR